MSSVESVNTRNTRTRSWLKFAGGTPCPAFGWSGSFINVFKEKMQPKLGPEAGLVLIAVGDDEKDIVHAVYGEISPDTLIKSIARATNDMSRLSAEDTEVFDEVYGNVVAEAGGSTVNILLMTVGADNPERVSMAHFGPQAISELAPRLGALTTQLSTAG